MRELVLQMHTSVEGFVARLDGKNDWMSDVDDELRSYENEIVNAADTLLMGREMTDEFVTYWTKVTECPDSTDYAFAKKMIDIPKVVFTKTLDESPWSNTVLAKGDLVEEVNRRKNQPGKDILVYGVGSLVSSLIKKRLIDEYNFFVNPVALGAGMTIFNSLEDKLNLRRVKTRGFDCEIVFLRYEPRGNR